MPTSVSRLLEEAVRFLDTSHAAKEGELKQSLEMSLNLLKEVAAGNETEANENRVADLSRLLQSVSESIQEEGFRVKGIEEKQDVLATEITGMKDDLNKNFQLLERFCQEESELRQKCQQQLKLSVQNRKRGGSSVVRRAPRPLLTHAGAEQGALLGWTSGNFPRIHQQQQGLFTGNMPLPMPAVIAPCNIQPVAPTSSRTSASAKVSRGLPSRPSRTLCTGLAGIAATNKFHSLSRATPGVKQQAMVQPVKKEQFDVFSLDSDLDSD